MCKQCARELALMAMAEKARAMGLHGVAFAFTASVKKPEGKPDFWTMSALVVDQLSDMPEDTTGWSPTGANYFGIAAGKLAQTIRMGALASVPADPSKTPVGEFGYRGCVVYEHGDSDTLMRASFSGGTEEEDVEIAVAGIVAMHGALDYLIECLDETMSQPLIVVLQRKRKENKKTKKSKKRRTSKRD